MELKTCSWSAVIILFSLSLSFGLSLEMETEELVMDGNGNGIQTELEEIPQAEGDDRYLACYWGYWSTSADYPGNLTIANFDATLCTHLIFSFAHVKADGDIFDIASPDLYWDLEGKKTENPALKTILAIGGYGDEIRRNFSALASSLESRGTFVARVKYYMETYFFNGLDFDWEYPNYGNESPDDKDNFVQLIKETREGLNELTEKHKRNYTLSAAVGCGQEIIKAAYDIEEMANFLDYFHLMTYDFKMYLESDKEIGHHSPLHPEGPGTSSEFLAADAAVKTFLDGGAEKHQLVVGMATYGRTYELMSREKHNFHDLAKGLGAPGPITKTQGTMTYYEFCHQVPLSPSPWEFHFDPVYQIPYAFNSSLWIGYDDEESAVIKTDYVNDNELGGLLVWSIEQDDCNNLCGGWYKCPIISAIKRRQEYHSQQRNSMQ